MSSQYFQMAQSGHPTLTWLASQTPTILISGVLKSRPDPRMASFWPSHPESPRAPSPLCEGAFFFRVKVRYLVGKVLKGIDICTSYVVY
jgi:hypothetical protein